MNEFTTQWCNNQPTNEHTSIYPIPTSTSAPISISTMDLIMNPMLLDGDDSSFNLPLFSRSGKPLSTAERQRMAQRKSICLNCGIKTHEKRSMMGKVPLTNALVLQGKCRKCHGLSEDAVAVNEHMALQCDVCCYSRLRLRVGDSAAPDLSSVSSHRPTT